MGFGVAIDDVGTRHSNLETVMSLRPHFIKISDVLVRGIARSTVKREMLRSLRHIAETIDAVMVAEGIEHVEDVDRAARPRPALRPGLLHGAPGAAVPDAAATTSAPSCAASRRTPRRRPPIASPATTTTTRTTTTTSPIAGRACSRRTNAIPRNAFGRAEDEITSDFAHARAPSGRARARREPPRRAAPAPPPRTPQPWQPLSDDEATGEALLSSLRSAPKTRPKASQDRGDRV